MFLEVGDDLLVLVVFLTVFGKKVFKLQLQLFVCFLVGVFDAAQLYFAPEFRNGLFFEPEQLFLTLGLRDEFFDLLPLGLHPEEAALFEIVLAEV